MARKSSNEPAAAPEQSFSVDFAPHPAREVVKDPTSGRPILDDKGQPVRVPIIFNTQMVLVNGVHVAYCGTEPGMPVNFIAHYPRAFAEAVTKAVESKLGGKSKASVPPAFTPPSDTVEE